LFNHISLRHGASRRNILANALRFKPIDRFGFQNPCRAGMQEEY